MLEELQRENSDLLQFLYACPIGLIQMDEAGGMIMVNPIAMQLLMALSDGEQSINLFEALARFAPELRHMVETFEPHHGQVCQGHRIYLGRSLRSRSEVPKVLACTIVKLDNDRLIATLEDVSERVAQERRLKQADAWFASFINQPESFAVLGIDADGLIETLEDSARQQTGFDQSELAGSHLSVLDRADPSAAAVSIAEEIDLARRDGWHLAEGWSALRDGGRYRCQRLISVRGETTDDARRVAGYTVVLRPVSRHRLDAEMLRRRLTTDLLTGAYNRGYFFDVVDEEIRRCAHRGKPVGLIVLDIDHFKLVNDTYGHGVGDQVLQAVVGACMSALRPRDIFARIGGEEFAALVPSADARLTAEIAERMRSAIAATAIAVDDSTLQVTASLGYVVRNAADEFVADLLHHADRALYAAKRSGRNRVIGEISESAAA